jgi:hypothetical protein
MEMEVLLLLILVEAVVELQLPVLGFIAVVMEALEWLY